MDVSDIKQFELFEPDKDTKAFVYQQVHELENDIQGLGDVTVTIERKEKANVETGQVVDVDYAVTFAVDPKETNLEVRAEARDVVTACIEAKEKLKRKLIKIMTFASGEDRNQAIDTIVSSNGYLH